MSFKFQHPFEKYQKYNLNWSLSKRVSRKLMQNEILQVIDIGAAGLSVPELNGFYNIIDYIAFETDEKEIKKLSRNPKTNQFNTFQAYNYFVGKDSKKTNFYSYKLSELNSSFLPDSYFIKNFIGGDNFEIKDFFQVESTSLNTIKKKDSINPDFLKIDTQGSELEILINAEDILEECLMIESEVMFVPIYEKQPLFHEISSFLYKKNYQLFYLNRAFAQRESCKKSCRGQLVYGDALFGLNLQIAKKLSLSKQIKYCCLLINYGIIDAAIELHDANPEIGKKNYQITRYLNNYRKSAKLEFFFKGIINIFIIKILKIIKSNGMRTDMDRAWNIR